MTTVQVAPGVIAQPASVLEKRVVYLFGLGATHGSIKFKGSTQSLIMPGLIEKLSLKACARSTSIAIAATMVSSVSSTT